MTLEIERMMCQGMMKMATGLTLMGCMQGGWDGLGRAGRMQWGVGVGCMQRWYLVAGASPFVCAPFPRLLLYTQAFN
jgi:hypothetical protein